MTDSHESSGNALSEDELKTIIADHRVFLRSNGSAGARADLSGANLTGVKLKDLVGEFGIRFPAPPPLPSGA